MRNLHRQCKLWRHLLKRGWGWFKTRARSRWASAWLGVFSFLDSAIPGFPFPPEVLFAAMLSAVPKRATLYTIIITGTAVLGSFLPYVAGVYIIGAEDVAVFGEIASSEAYERIEEQLSDTTFLPLLLAVLLPAPSVPFMMAAGSLSMPLWLFFVAVLLGRGLRFIAIAAIVHYYDEYMLEKLARHSNTATAVFLFLLVLYLAFVFLEP